jgi:hypothetical protein
MHCWEDISEKIGHVHKKNDFVDALAWLEVSQKSHEDTGKSNNFITFYQFVNFYLAVL